jgi:translation initiation factor 1
MTDSPFRLVYSTDPEKNVLCKSCKQLVSACICQHDEEVVIEKINALLLVEKKGRGGKTVSVIKRLPRNAEFVGGMVKELKKICGAGGTCGTTSSEGFVEIQGEKREEIRKYLKGRSISCKG